MGLEKATITNCVTNERISVLFNPDEYTLNKENNFAQAVLYAADNDIEVVEGASGALFNSRFSREAFEHAYREGVSFAIVSSDLNTADHNIPTLYDEAMQV